MDTCVICGKPLEARKGTKISGFRFCTKCGNAYEMTNGNMQKAIEWYMGNK